MAMAATSKTPLSSFILRTVDAPPLHIITVNHLQLFGASDLIRSLLCLGFTSQRRITSLLKWSYPSLVWSRSKKEGEPPTIGKVEVLIVKASPTPSCAESLEHEWSRRLGEWTSGRDPSWWSQDMSPGSQYLNRAGSTLGYMWQRGLTQEKEG
jgi:hypothetical protein